MLNSEKDKQYQYCRSNEFQNRCNCNFVLGSLDKEESTYLKRNINLVYLSIRLYFRGFKKTKPLDEK